jgi:hypothetical protein
VPQNESLVSRLLGRRKRYHEGKRADVGERGEVKVARVSALVGGWLLFSIKQFT